MTIQVNNIRAKIGNNYRIDDDGFMTIRACILKEGIFDYLEKEFDKNGTNDIKSVYIPASEFTEKALKTGNGKFVIDGTEHDWRTIDNIDDGKTVGSISGELSKKGNKIECDILIKDKDTIEKIKNKELIEVSAGYLADFIKEPGNYDGTPYDYRQSNIVFNHILLLPKGEGRCGSDVRVFNKKSERKENMSIKIRYRVGNVDKTKEFSNEDDARKAEEMVSDVEESKKIDVENAMNQFEEIKKEVEAKNAELDATRKELEEVKNKIDELLSPEAQDALADEVLEQREAEDAIVEEEIDDSEKEEVKNACKAMNRSARVQYLAKKVLNKRGVTADVMTEDQLVGAFMALASEAKAKRAGNKKAGTIVGAKTLNSAIKPFNKLDRIYGKKGE